MSTIKPRAIDYDDEAAAGAFYEKCGFRDVAHVAHRGVPLVYYEMLIPSNLEMQ